VRVNQPIEEICVDPNNRYGLKFGYCYPIVFRKKIKVVGIPVIQVIRRQGRAAAKIKPCSAGLSKHELNHRLLPTSEHFQRAINHRWRYE